MKNRLILIALLSLLLFAAVASAQDTTVTPPSTTHDDLEGTSGLRRDRIYDLAWNPQGTLLAVAATDGLALYDNSNELIIRLIDGKGVGQAAWNRDGNLLAGITNDEGLIEVFRATDYRQIGYKISTNAYAGFSWNPHEDIIAYADTTDVKLWNIQSDTVQPIRGAYLTEFGTPSIYSSYPAVDSFSSVLWSRDGKLLAMTTQYDGIYIWDSSLREISQHLEYNVLPYSFHTEYVAWGPANDYLLIVPTDFMTGTYDQLSVKTGVVTQVDKPFKINNATGEFAIQFNRVSLHLIDTRTQVALVNLSEHINGYEVTAFTWSPDGTRLAVGDDAGRIYIWRRSETH